MCGIVGILNWNSNKNVSAPLLHKMSATLRHRGPDAEGHWLKNNVGLGHTRLSIIDLSKQGKQPFENEDGSLVMVCNGEIYNYEHLRKELIERGHTFRSSTDVEVILHLYEDYGAGCLEHLVGMFSFCIWNKRNRSMFLARDRIGEKPLYYTKTSTGFYFASEIKAFWNIPELEKKVNKKMSFALVSFAFPPDPFTFYHGVLGLPPATYMIVTNDGKVQQKRYWNVDFSRRRHSLKLPDAVAEFKHIFREVMIGCLESDVPVGVFLSGGLDSGIITAEASQLVDELTTFTIRDHNSPESDPDWLRSKITLSKLPNVKNKSFVFSPRSLASLPRIISQYDSPVIINELLFSDGLASLTRNHVKVALAGNGADEIFGGYDYYNQALILDRLKPGLPYLPWALLPLLPKHLANRLLKFKPLSGLKITQIRGFLTDLAGKHFSELLMTPEMVKQFPLWKTGNTVNKYAEECNPQNYLDTVMYTDLMIGRQHVTTLVPDISGMAHGLEIRSPFLNHKLIEFAASLPIHMKVPNAFSQKKNKLIIKKSLEHLLPSRLIYSKKIGFGSRISLQSLIMEPASRKLLEKYVCNGRYLTFNIFSPSGVKWAMQHSPLQVWILLTFSIWAELNFFCCSINELEADMESLINHS